MLRICLTSGFFFSCLLVVGCASQPKQSVIVQGALPAVAAGARLDLIGAGQPFVDSHRSKIEACLSGAGFALGPGKSQFSSEWTFSDRSLKTDAYVHADPEQPGTQARWLNGDRHAGQGGRYASLTMMIADIATSREIYRISVTERYRKGAPPYDRLIDAACQHLEKAH